MIRRKGKDLKYHFDGNNGGNAAQVTPFGIESIPKSMAMSVFDFEKVDSGTVENVTTNFDHSTGKIDEKLFINTNTPMPNSCIINNDNSVWKSLTNDTTKFTPEKLTTSTSSSISKMSGNGLKSKDNDNGSGNNDCNSNYDSHTLKDPYSIDKVTKICERLNHQNRVAKRSSMDCQTLFLSLYFQTNIDVTYAVIIGLRQNGILVYVPKYDMKGACFLKDLDGNVQVDPKLFDVTSSSTAFANSSDTFNSTRNDSVTIGLPPSNGFDAVEGCRKFTEGKLTLREELKKEKAVTCPNHKQNAKQNNDGIRKKNILELCIPAFRKSITFRELDVVTVQLSCNPSSSFARIPPPRLHLVSGNDNGDKQTNDRERSSTIIEKGSKSNSRNDRYCKKVDIDSKLVKQAQNEVTKKGRVDLNHSLNTNDKEGSRKMAIERSLVLSSIHKILASIEIIPNLNHITIRSQRKQTGSKCHNRGVTVPGRFVFGGFRNPDTYLAMQEATAAIAIGKSALSTGGKPSPSNDYDTTRKIEKEVTSRIQRISSEKRNSRRTKSTKR